ncbi:MAG: L-rhamnose mutarotase [Saprospiraceae bacterium]
MQRFCLTLDLKNDPNLIAEYERYHEKIPEAIEQSIRDAGITNLQIYRYDTRMFMIIEAEDDFTFAKKAEMDAANAAVQEWETLMWQFQSPLPQAKPGEKWLLMQQIFQL